MIKNKSDSHRSSSESIKGGDLTHKRHSSSGPSFSTLVENHNKVVMPKALKKNDSILQSSQESLPLGEPGLPPDGAGKMTHSTGSHSRTPSDSAIPDAQYESTDQEVAPPGEQTDKVNGQTERPYTPGSEKSTKSGKTKSEKKRKIWHNVQTVLSPTYKSKTQDFRRIFKDVPQDERLISDYSCALQKDILVQGRMYVSQNWVCFYANIFGWESNVFLQFKDITAVTKEKTARVIPNAIQLSTATDKYFFSTFSSREKAFVMLFRLWQNALLEQPMAQKEMWQWVHLGYGNDLGLNSSDDDYIAPSPGDEDVDVKLLGEMGDAGLEVKDADSSNAGISDGQEVLAEDNEVAMVTSEGTSSSKRSQRPIPKLASIDNPDLPTDQTDNTESEDNILSIGVLANKSKHFHKDDIIYCECPKHNREYLNEVFNMNVDSLFQILFGNGNECQFYKDFLDRRKTVDLVYVPWPETPNVQGNKERNISYTLALSHTLGPKCSPVVEKQILYKSVPGERYIIECECYNSGIPYSDSFYVVNRYCLTRVSANKCRMAVHSEVKYKKSIWGIAKGFIEKNCIEGIKDYFDNIAICLRNECNSSHIVASGSDEHRKKVIRRRRGLSMRAAEEKVTSSGSFHSNSKIDLPHPQIKQQIPAANVTIQTKHVTPYSVDVLVRMICIILILLVLFNTVLFYKLWHLEAVANHLYPPSSTSADISKFPQSQGGWNHLLKHQENLHTEEVKRWKDILTTSVLLIDQMKMSLIELKKNIEDRESNLKK